MGIESDLDRARENYYLPLLNNFLFQYIDGTYNYKL